MHKFIDNEGTVLVRARDAFSRRAEMVWRDQFPDNRISHMRCGRFSVVVPDNLGECVAAPTYETGSPSSLAVSKDGPFWERSRADRLDQLDRIETALRETHPHYQALTDAIAAERKFLA